MPTMLLLVGLLNTSENGGTAYYANATTTWLIVKEDHLEEAKAKFIGSGVSIIADGIIMSWQSVVGLRPTIDRLSSITVTQPHAAYAPFTHRLKHKWTYLI